MITTKKKRAWTTGELARLADLRRRGFKVSAIARRLGRTPDAVHHAVVYYRIEIRQTHARPSTESILSLHQRGLSGVAIARRLGCGRHTVKRRLKALGIRPNGIDHATRLRAARKATETKELSGSSFADGRCREAAAMGWPEARTPAEAGVCQLLLDGGPTQFGRLVEVTGRIGVWRELASLIRWGVVVRVRRGVYDLAPRVRARRDEAC